MIPGSMLRDTVFYHGIVIVSAAIINFFTPAEHVIAQQNMLLSSKAILTVVRGCDGAGAMFLLSAAVIAFPTALKQKLQGLLTGIFILYLTNQLRIVGLYYIVSYKPEWFISIHTYLAPTLIILVSILYFMWWAISKNHNFLQDKLPVRNCG